MHIEFNDGTDGSEFQIRSVLYADRLLPNEQAERYVRPQRWVEPGRLVYCPHLGENAPVVGLSFDTIGLQWLVSVPGYTAPADRFSPARADRPTGIWQRITPHSCQRIGEVPAALVTK